MTSMSPVMTFFFGHKLSKLWAAAMFLAVASFDENNAFTRVVTPTWMWPWVAAPPALASDVWPLLSAELKQRVSPSS